MRRRWILLSLLVVAAFPGTAFAGGGGGCHEGATTEGSGEQVALSMNCFGPTVLRVAPGTTVRWTNEDQVSHTVTAAGGVFDRELAAGERFSYTFTQPGVYPYYCMIHPRMAGAIVVGTQVQAVGQTAPAGSALSADKTESSTLPLAAMAIVMGPVGFLIGRSRIRRV